MPDYPTTAREYLATTIAEKFEMDFDTGDRGEIREFTAIALTDGVPLSRQQQLNYGSNSLGSSTDAARISRYLVKAMIIGNANDEMLRPTENPHRYLLDPCSLETTPNVATTVKIILMYTTYITSKDFNIAGQSLIKRGDKIRVTMTVDSRDANIRTDSGEVVEIVSKASHDPFLQTVCDSLQGKFDLSKMKASLGEYTGAGGGAQMTKCVLSGKDSHRTAEDIAAAYRLPLYKAESIVKTAYKINENFDPGWLANAINGESGFDTKAVNSKTKATGLIQWMPATAASALKYEKDAKKKKGKYTEYSKETKSKAQQQMYGFGWSEQMRYIEKYFGHQEYTSQGDVMMRIFYPVARGKPDNFDLAAHWASRKKGRKEETFVSQNNGIRTKADYVNKFVDKAKLKPPC
tara:strand:- start:3382 stop:4599 length:1218 start_codon:yes stop_codon:yes gene_type:complete